MPIKPSQSHFSTIRGLHYHVRTWGQPSAPTLFMLHGWMDASASFQFLVDALQQDWYVIAPDWRGFGLSQWNPQGYWVPDYLGDLDALLAQYSAEAPAKLIGHSLGGNIVCLYAGIRPERVSHVVSLDAIGVPRNDPAEAPARYRRWLDEIIDPPPLTHYANLDAVVARLKKNNPRLSDDKARFLAPHWAEELADGSARLRSDPAHKLVYPLLYRLEEATACWRHITARVLLVEAEDSYMRKWINEHPTEFAKRKAAFSNLTEHRVRDAGHMLHHDQPEELAPLIEAFLAGATYP
ncbi:MAG: alpha/beta hydrolase [Gammaproteobacteria bacterium]|nr:alpha/beta hydrolase [Gammaproteobacteria bacterium]